MAREFDSLKFLLISCMLLLIVKKTRSDIILRKLEHLKLINPLELIYKDDSWHQQLKSTSNFDKQAKKLLFFNSLARSSDKIKTSPKYETKSLFLSTKPNEVFSNENGSSKILTTSKHIKDVDDSSRQVENEENIVEQKTTNSNLIKPKQKCQLNQSHQDNESSSFTSYKCLTCSDIKSSFECKKFEENELREIVNMFCCECNSFIE